MITQLREKYKEIEGERFFHELFEKEEYKDILNRPLNTVIDVGALAGEFGAYIYEKAGTIYALEPYMPYFTELTENINEFHLDKIKPYRLALAGHNGIAILKGSQERGGNLLTEAEEQGEIVRTKTLARFMEDEGIRHVDVLKIDIEGGEKAVFESHDFAQVAGKISCIIGEHFHDHEHLLINHGFTMTTANGNYLFVR